MADSTPSTSANLSTTVPNSKVSGSMRITSSGKISSYVSQALHYLMEEGKSPLVLHTLPPNLDASLSASSNHCTATIPRLISVVEIVKREYLKALQDQGSSRLVGLYQYNHLGNIEDLRPEEAARDEQVEDRPAVITSQLTNSKNHLKLNQTPYMKITLSLTQIDDSIGQATTFQAPLKRTLSKSAKTRAKKREKRERLAVVDQLVPTDA